MNSRPPQLGRKVPVALGMLAMLLSARLLLAGDAAQLVSLTITNGTPMLPRTIFTQTWTMKNTGTTTWTPTFSGFTMNLRGTDNLGAVPPSAKPYASHTLSTPIGSGISVAPGAQATFTMTFIAPETAGVVTDQFQLNNANSVFFGPTNLIQIVVLAAGSTNQYDRARAVAYANNYAGFVNSDGYFWTNGSSYGTYAPLTAAPASGLGDEIVRISFPAVWASRRINAAVAWKFPVACRPLTANRAPVGS